MSARKLTSWIQKVKLISGPDQADYEPEEEEVEVVAADDEEEKEEGS